MSFEELMCRLLQAVDYAVQERDTDFLREIQAFATAPSYDFTSDPRTVEAWSLVRQHAGDSAKIIESKRRYWESSLGSGFLVAENMAEFCELPELMRLIFTDIETSPYLAKSSSASLVKNLMSGPSL